MSGRSDRYGCQITNDGVNSGSQIYRLVNQGASVLDVGCATGYLGRALKEKNCRCIGIEIDPEAAGIAKAYYEKILEGDVFHVLPELENEQFDFIILADILEHLPSPAELLRGLAPFLAKDGELLISLPNVSHISVACELLKGRFHYRDTGLLDFTHLRFFDRRSALELLQDAGYSGIISNTVIKDPQETEFKTNLAEFPPDTVAMLDSNPDARVYQFIIRAVPSERIHPLAEVAALQRKLDDAQKKLDDAQKKLDDTQKKLNYTDDALKAKYVVIETLQKELADTPLVIDALQKKLADTSVEIGTLQKKFADKSVEIETLQNRKWTFTVKPRRLVVDYSQYVWWLLTLQGPKRIKEKKIVKVIERSNLFDASFYARQNPDVKKAGRNALIHFIRYGAAEGRNPNPLFDTSYYLKKNRDVASAGVNPLYHYLRHGASEGRDPSPLFSSSYYLEHNQDVAKAGKNPLAHYLTCGAKEGRTTSLALSPFEARIASSHIRIPAFSHTTESLADELRGLMPQSRFVIALSHDNYVTVVGGVQNLLGDEQRICNDNQVAHLQFFPTNSRPTLAKPEEPFYVSINCNGQLVTECQAGLALEALNQLVQGTTGKSLAGVILHQLLGFNINWVRRLVEETGGGKALFWAHDFFALCPSCHLLRNDNESCNAPSVESNSCLICAYGEERARHLQAFHDLFNSVDLTLVSPSHYVDQMWKEKANFRLAGRSVMPHCRIEWDNTQCIPKSDSPQLQLKVGFLGFPCYHKGWTTYEHIVKRFGIDPRYQFFQFSERKYGSLPLTFVPVSVSSENRSAMLDALKAHHIDVAFLWSLCPETFSFTLHEAMAAGCYVVTHVHSGNIQHSVRESNCGTVLGGEEEVAAWFESGRLIEATRDFQEEKARFGSLVLTPGSYRIIFENFEEQEGHNGCLYQHSY